MRGLPRPPAGVVLIQAIWQVGPSSEVTNDFYVLAPGSEGAGAAELTTLLGDWFLSAVPDLLSILPTDVTLTTCRLTSYGEAPITVQFVPSFNVGAIGTSNPINGALVLTWRSLGRTTAALGHTFLPLSDSFVDDTHARLKSISWSECQNAASNYVQHISEISSPDGGNCALVVLHRSESGRPLSVANVAPVDIGDASPFVGTLRRRIRARRPASSAP